MDEPERVTVTRTFRGVDIKVTVKKKPKPTPEKKTKDVWVGNLFTGIKKKICFKPDDGMIEAKEYLKRAYSSRVRVDRRAAPIIDDYKPTVLGEELNLEDKQ